MPPFRNPNLGGDGDPPEQALPDYFTPSSSDEEIKLPDYFQPAKQEDKSSTLSKIWKKVSEPLTDAPSRFAKKVSDYIDSPSLKRSPTEARIRGFLGGVTQGAGDFASSLTSPLNIGLAATGVGEEIPAISRVARMGTKLLSAPVVAEGATNAYKGIKDRDFSKFAQGVVETAGGLASGLHGEKTPVEAPKTEELPIRQQREIPYKFQGELPVSETPPIKQPEVNLNEPSVRQTDKGTKYNSSFINKEGWEEFGPKPKESFVNPFEKKVEVLKGKTMAEHAEDAAKDMEAKGDINGAKIQRDTIKKGGYASNEVIDSEPKPKAEFLALNEQGEPMYNIVSPDGKKFTYTGPDELIKQGLEVPETPKDSIPMRGEDIRNKMLAERNKAQELPDYFKPSNDVTDTSGRSIAPEQKPDAEKFPVNARQDIITPEVISPNKPDFTAEFIKENPKLEGQFDRVVGRYDANARTLNVKLKDGREVYVSKDNLQGLNEGDTAKAIKNSPKDEIIDLQGGLGGAKPPKDNYPPSSGPNGPVLDKLFSSLEEARGLNKEQEAINKQERARRFAAFAGVKDEGVAGAAKSLSKLRGEFEKVNPGEGLQLNPKETDSLFTAVKRAKITEGEKARGYTALFKIMNGESVPQRNELAILDDVFGNGFASRITELHGGIGAIGLKLSKAANTAKSMENAISLAAPLRHGAGLMYRKEFYPAFADMFKFFANKEYHDAAMNAIQEHPNYSLYRESGGFFAKSGSLMKSEEEFLNSYVGSIPKFTGIPQTVGASQRGYTGFLNKLRFDTFNGMIKTMNSLGLETHSVVDGQPIPSKGARAIAKYINTATGRGDLPFNLNRITNELNLVLWSPRMMASRITMLTNPKIYTDLPKGMRLEGLKSLLGIASMSTIINTLGILSGAKVSSNILSTDFMKSRYPNGRVIDPNAGFQQYIVAAARFLAGKTDSAIPTSRLEIAGRFLANKESPAASLAHSILTAKKFDAKTDNPLSGSNYTDQYNNKTSVQSEIGKRFVPIFVEDLNDLIVTEKDFTNNIGLDTAMTGASLAGMAQDYPAPSGKGKLSLGKMKLK